MWLTIYAFCENESMCSELMISLTVGSSEHSLEKYSEGIQT